MNRPLTLILMTEGRLGKAREVALGVIGAGPFVKELDGVIDAVGIPTNVQSKRRAVEFETRAKNLLNGGVEPEGVAYAQLAEKPAALGVVENEHNLNNEIGRGGFTAAFLRQCLTAIKADA